MDSERQFVAPAQPEGAGHAPCAERSAPSPWVGRFLDGIAPGGRVLDVACGSGRHLRLALERGRPVTGTDRDLTGVQDLAGRDGVELIEADLECGGPPPFAGRTFAGVIVANYLWRPLLPAIVSAVGPSGVLIYETFGRGNERYGKPSNPAFLLEPGELIEAVRPRLGIVAYEHVTLTGPRPAIVQRIAAVGPGHRWNADPPGPDR